MQRLTCLRKQGGQKCRCCCVNVFQCAPAEIVRDGHRTIGLRPKGQAAQVALEARYECREKKMSAPRPCVHGGR